ncbi:MAG: asparagine synthase-related protein [Mobilicoccus sp.]|nr:asparagine synthase-related protein [Mobilicoccus sp.]
MCGVAAVVGSLPAGADLDAAADAIATRGPDGGSRLACDGLLMLASRLAHWEEGSPWQPFAEPDGSVAVFNGELFNLTELQALLRRPGLSEVEVLLAGLRAHGPAFLRHVDGQFALIARPSADGPVYLARDRFGIAPLYWSATCGAVVAASTLRAVLALRGEPAAFDDEGLATILADWAPAGDRSPWAGVQQVRPGHVLTVTDGRVVADDRWVADHPSAVQDDGLDALETALREAVRVRLRSTGTVACLVSGGIDSTVIGALAREEGADLALSLCLQGDDVVGERQHQVARALDLPLVQHVLTPAETMDCFEHYVRTRRVPLVRLGPVGMTALARRAAAEGVRGVLSGEGADELFAGYDSSRILAARAGAFGPPASLPWAEFGDPEFGAERGARWARSYWRGLVAFSSEAGARRVDILRPVADLLRAPLREVVTDERPMPDTADPAVARASDPLAARRQVDLERLLGSYLLTVQGDHAWMEEGVELRPPFLASPVADWALSRPPAEFVSIGEGKRPVRALLPRLAQRRPELAGLGFAKAAFRVDVSFVLTDPDQFDRLQALVARAPRDRIDVDALVARMGQIAGAGTCSEAESQIIVFASSLALLDVTAGA